jgi:hypothetical protein
MVRIAWLTRELEPNRKLFPVTLTIHPSWVLLVHCGPNEVPKMMTLPLTH